MREGRIGGAALDVFATQPLPPDHPYFSFDNVIITPHMAGITEESMMRMGIGAAEETMRILGGDLPVNFCNPRSAGALSATFSGLTTNTAPASQTKTAGDCSPAVSNRVP